MPGWTDWCWRVVLVLKHNSHQTYLYAVQTLAWLFLMSGDAVLVQVKLFVIDFLVPVGLFDIFILLIWYWSVSSWTVVSLLLFSWTFVCSHLQGFSEIMQFCLGLNDKKIQQVLSIFLTVDASLFIFHQQGAGVSRIGFLNLVVSVPALKLWLNCWNVDIYVLIGSCQCKGYHCSSFIDL